MLLNMGQNNSLPKPRRRSLRSPFLPKRNHKISLSHTFSLPQDNQKLEQVNINLATEEELMTLSGINREIARSIVKHRQVIGRFRKIEDLALVGGIGAEKLDSIRGEVCVKNNSCSSSRAQSFDSLKSSDSRHTTKLVDINRASVFDLQCVNGMTQEMAANIVSYREKKGPFKKLEDLLKVKSVNTMRFSNILYQLTIDSYNVESNLSRTSSASEVLSNGMSMNGNIYPTGTSTPLRHRKSASAPVKLHVANGLPSPSSLGDIFELLSAYSYRPIPEEDFKYTRNGKDAFRIATWNLDEFTVEKAQNLGVREVICRTILENRLSIICIQDVCEEEALQLICDELNSPRLRKVTEFRKNSHEWEFMMLESNLAFIYDAESGGLHVELLSTKQVIIDDYKAVIGDFAVGLIHIQILNANLPDNIPIGILEDRFNKLKLSNRNLILLGDFTNLNCNDQICGLHSVLALHTDTGYPSVKRKYSDNMLIPTNLKRLMTGYSSLVRQGLTHLAIPNGWSWGGPVSPHCPIWSEFYAIPPIENGF